MWNGDENSLSEDDKNLVRGMVFHASCVHEKPESESSTVLLESKLREVYNSPSQDVHWALGFWKLMVKNQKITYLPERIIDVYDLRNKNDWRLEDTADAIEKERAKQESR